MSVPIGARFICKVSDTEKALMEVVHPYSYPNAHMLCCRVVTGTLIDIHGKPFGAGTLTDMPLDRVAAAVRRYNARQATTPEAALSEFPEPTGEGRTNN